MSTLIIFEYLAFESWIINHCFDTVIVMHNHFSINIATIDDVLSTIASIAEFDESAPHTREKYVKTLSDKDVLVLQATSALNEPSGFLIAYDRYGDGSFYCWRVGVSPSFRRKGILRMMMQFTEEWALQRGYKELQLFTRNSRREMLSYLVNNGFMLLEIIPTNSIDDYRIKAVKRIGG